MNVLTATERSALLAHLSNEASDDILLDAVRAVIDSRTRMREDMASIAKALKINSTAPVKAVEQKPVAAEEPKAEAKNDEPPGEAAARVSTQTKDIVLRKLQTGPATAAAINQFINGKSSNTQKVLKRMWATNLISYADGYFKLK